MRKSTDNSEPLVKQALAERLRAEIVTGKLKPGIRIVEGTWARRFGVAQASIREAVNVLAQEGFVSEFIAVSLLAPKLNVP